ncbi:DUF4124 domain-containing protein [Pseudomonas sp. dw_358]|uniref:DUF4124 domain-containing protein n=1 Tax=Pseudomonas sp. dw_358 TaxID=2720083 RepID=UPI001BD6B187|nr:DUF4124 domain-containing protein [Pseudomonas sp. dw_358]
MIKLIASLALSLAPFAMAAADAFKCVDREGRVTFAQVPCAPEQGRATWAASTLHTKLYSLDPEADTPQKVNEKAIKILQSGYNVKHTYTVKRIPISEPPKTPPEPRPRPAFEACNSAPNARYCGQ